MRRACRGPNHICHTCNTSDKIYKKYTIIEIFLSIFIYRCIGIRKVYLYGRRTQIRSKTDCFVMVINHEKILGNCPNHFYNSGRTQTKVRNTMQNHMGIIYGYSGYSLSHLYVGSANTASPLPYLVYKLTRTK